MEDIVLDREYKSSLRCLKIGDKVAELPIIQGGMGGGVIDVYKRQIINTVHGKFSGTKVTV